ncbi:hypothetical protein E4099_28585, partial [Streptomyces palmae]
MQWVGAEITHRNHPVGVRHPLPLVAPRHPPAAGLPYQQLTQRLHGVEQAVLADRARRNHVTLAWAVSPGQNFCFASAGDAKALARKLD